MNLNVLRYGFVLVFALSATFALAYIPEYSTIMIRVATNHGNGTYQIQRSVKWTENETPMEVSELWTVGESGQMKVVIAGQGRLRDAVQGEISYTTSRKSYAVEGRGVGGANLPNQFSEHYFHLRSSAALRSMLVRAGLAPKESTENRPSLGAGSQVRHTPQSFMSLSRVDGTIAYAVGPAQHPTFFIAQDQFVVSKIAFPSGPNLIAKNFQNYPAGLYFPKTVTHLWGDKKVEVNTIKVTHLGKTGADRFALSAAPTPLKISSSQIATEFYSQFR